MTTVPGRHEHPVLQRAPCRAPRGSGRQLQAVSGGWAMLSFHLSGVVPGSIVSASKRR